jgi:hypothetical protein
LRNHLITLQNIGIQGRSHYMSADDRKLSHIDAMTDLVLALEPR